jgi:hypothetical protein
MQTQLALVLNICYYIKLLIRFYDYYMAVRFELLFSVVESGIHTNFNRLEVGINLELELNFLF